MSPSLLATRILKTPPGLSSWRSALMKVFLLLVFVAFASGQSTPYVLGTVLYSGAKCTGAISSVVFAQSSVTQQSCNTYHYVNGTVLYGTPATCQNGKYVQHLCTQQGCLAGCTLYDMSCTATGYNPQYPQSRGYTCQSAFPEPAVLEQDATIVDISYATPSCSGAITGVTVTNAVLGECLLLNPISEISAGGSIATITTCDQNGVHVSYFKDAACTVPGSKGTVTSAITCGNTCPNTYVGNGTSYAVAQGDGNPQDYTVSGTSFTRLDIFTVALCIFAYLL